MVKSSKRKFISFEWETYFLKLQTHVIVSIILVTCVSSILKLNGYLKYPFIYIFHNGQINRKPVKNIQNMLCFITFVLLYIPVSINKVEMKLYTWNKQLYTCNTNSTFKFPSVYLIFWRHQRTIWIIFAFLRGALEEELKKTCPWRFLT